MSLQRRTWLVTGGAGYFGRAFTRFLLRETNPAAVRIFSRSESRHAEMAAHINDPRVRFLIGDVSRRDRVERALAGVDIVIHAAAQKFVPSCEADPWQAIETNVVGTHNVAQACISAGVRQAIFLSTDKAAAPNTLYGSTKLAAERLWNQSNVYAASTDTRFAATRYGNVVGSTGSVIPLWQAQRNTGRISLTDPGMTRFFMSSDEAVALVWLACCRAQGGEVFVPKIPSARLDTLAEAVAPGCTYDLVGMRPGEKRHEVLVTEDEARCTWDAGDHYVIEPESRPWGNGRIPDAGWCKVPDGWTYRSDSNPWQLSTEDIVRLVA